MRKWLLIIIVIIALFFISAFLFLPKVLNVTNADYFNCNINVVNRFVMAKDNWNAWWPGKLKQNDAANKNVFEYNGYGYTIVGNKYNSVDIKTEAGDLTINGTIFFLPIGSDSIKVEWKYALETNSNPINKIYLSYATRRINNNMKHILKSMKAFLENGDNVYGMHIDRMTVKDTIVATTNFFSKQYPSTATIYAGINGIKNYIAANNAKQTNPPMLHVWLDSGIFHTTIGIPVNTIITGNTSYETKRLVPGKILVAQVKGGAHRADEALRQMALFMNDNNMSSPAIPFQSLVTNRMAEPDSTKWITKIYYPVF